mmetsp:Transcript_24320/g.53541  ORF Transcript_24320/g.53541 Transcript_24320/m.53541 type:complete len:576 (+) Transcript_24320:44-1771(+)
MPVVPPGRKSPAWLLLSCCGVWLVLSCWSSSNNSDFIVPATGDVAGGRVDSHVSAIRSRPQVLRSSTPLEGKSIGLAAATLAVMALVAGSKTRRTLGGTSGNPISAVVRFAFPSAGGRPRWKIHRRFLPYGGVPGWSRSLPPDTVKVKPWQKRTRPSFLFRDYPDGSGFKYWMTEKQRLKYHYNIKEKTMVRYLQKVWTKGESAPVERLMQVCESRLDNFCWRTGLTSSIPAGRNFVRNCNIELKTGRKDWMVVNIPSIRLKPGDEVRVRDHPNSKKLAEINNDLEGNVDVPKHIIWDHQTKTGTYTGICDPVDFPMPVQENHVMSWYSGDGSYGRDALRRDHTRYFPGTKIEIKKNFNGGLPRATEANVYNMRKGFGLNKRGRKRPPSLWGSKLPKYNVTVNPYKGDYARFKTTVKAVSPASFAGACTPSSSGGAFAGTSTPSVGQTKGLPLTVMRGHMRKTYVRNIDRDRKWYIKARRPNSAAKQRVLIMPDGTMWRRQPGMRHLVQKKSKKRINKLKKLVKMGRPMYGRLQRLLGRRPPTQTPEDFIMRKFNERRLTHHEGLSNEVGMAMWT